MIYLQLFLSFFKIGLFGFGGGYAILSLIQHEIEKYGWMSQQEFVDIVAISQMTPGPIGINSATYTGYTACHGAGMSEAMSILGSVVATSAIILPSVIIMLIVCGIYLKLKDNRWVDGSLKTLRVAVIGLIAAAALLLMTPENFIDWWSVALFALVFLGTLVWKLHPILLICIAGIAGFFIYSPAFHPISGSDKQLEQEVETVMAEMSVHEKVGQLFVVTTGRYNHPEELAYVDSLVTEDGLGGLIVMDDSLLRGMNRLNHLQSLAKVPLMVAVDGEWGPSMRYAEFPFFPRQMQLGALPNDSLIYLMGRAVGEQCQMAGLHVNYAPDVDVNNNPKNPVIGTRSFGDSRERVAEYGSAYMRGMQDAGIYACAKHFPGHGDTEVDSHRGLPTLPFSRERLDSLELYPFRRLIADGVEMVMLGHLNIPALDTVVSSLSHKIVTELLKKELGFKGIVVTDALGMKGVAEGRSPETVALMAYEAGVDILLMPREARKSIVAIEERVRDGRYSERELNERVRKVLMLKARRGMLAKDYSAQVDTTGLVQAVCRPQDSVLIERIAEQSMTVYKGSRVREFKSSKVQEFKGSRVAYVGYRAEWKVLRRAYGEREGLTGFGSTSGVQHDGTTTLLNTLRDSLQIDYYPLPIQCTEAQLTKVMQQVEQYDHVLLAFHDQSGRPSRQLINDSTHLPILAEWAKKQPITMVYFGNPYAMMDMPWVEDCETVIIGYADSEANERAVGNILLGKLPAIGKMPVQID